ncbi:MAG: S8 family serine peptidase [Anaerolineae bacterium]
MHRRILIMCLAFVILAAASVAQAQGPTPDASKSALKKVAPQVLDAAKGGAAEFFVMLSQQADLSGAGALSSPEAKRQYVYERVREVAEKSQDGVIRDVEASGAAYQRFALTNALLVRGDAKLVAKLAARPDVQRIEANPQVQAIKSGPDETVTSVNGPGTPWGITQIKADQVWAQGDRGAGIVVGIADTGVDWTHPAIQPKYRGWNGTSADHTYSWHDPIAHNPVPLDDQSHGTHVTGTILGDAGTDHIGVAPDAKWIGCRNMDSGVGTPARYIECMEFFLAPYAPGGDFLHGGNPSLGANIISNSWSCPTDEGCYPLTLQQSVAALRAAGIAFIAAAQNSGPACSTVTDPPGLFAETFSIGAYSQSGSSLSIAGFSSRGPVTADGSGRAKPDVSAPGVNVMSSIPGGSYGSKSGTSMATPHVAGIFALIWSAVPALKGNIPATEAIVRATSAQQTDNSCGVWANGRANNTWGYGAVDALAAVNAARSVGTVSGIVTAPGGAPAAGAQVSISGPGIVTYAVTADANGAYSATLAAGAYTLTASAFGSGSVSAPVTVPASGGVTQNLALISAAPVTVSGSVRQAGATTPLWAAVHVEGTSVSALTNASGAYSLSLPAGSYTLTAEANGYEPVRQSVTVAGPSALDFSLPLRPTTLLVDDDEGHDFEKLWQTSLDHMSRKYDTWEVRATGYGPTADVLDSYGLVIWEVGGPLHRLGAADAAQLQTYLDHGGRLLLSEPGAAVSDFRATYLQVTSPTAASGATVAGQGVLSGGTYAITSANLTDAPGAVTTGPNGQSILRWQGQSVDAGVAVSAAYRSIYLTLGLQNLPAASQDAFVASLVNWFSVTGCRLPGDSTYDGRISVADIERTTAAWSASSTDVHYRRNLDWNLDGKIDAADAQIVGSRWGATCR